MGGGVPPHHMGPRSAHPGEVWGEVTGCEDWGDPTLLAIHLYPPSSALPNPQSITHIPDLALCSLSSIYFLYTTIPAIPRQAFIAFHLTLPAAWRVQVCSKVEPSSRFSRGHSHAFPLIPRHVCSSFMLLTEQLIFLGWVVAPFAITFHSVICKDCHTKVRKN